MTTSDIITFGCRLNTFESEVMRRHMQDAGGMEDVVVVHTCAVTAEAERQARQTIRRTKRERPDARIVVTGCAAQLKPDAFAAMPEVTRVVGNEEKLKAGTWQGLFRPDAAPVVVEDIMTVRDTASHLVEGFDGRSRAFVQVQAGCDHRCTFCIIPFGRGNNRSVPIGEIVSQTRLLVRKGYREVVLTGVDITSFGKDLPGRPTLGQLCRRLLALVPDLPRLRLSSLDPAAVDDDLKALIASEPRLMPHVHLSVQAGDTMVLKRMKRRHVRDDVLVLCDELRRLRGDIVFGADLIAGFPTETDAMFQNTLDLVSEAGLTFLHVFPYSAREGTPASRMPQVAKPVRKGRAARLREAGDRALAGFLAGEVGRTRQVLIEAGGRGHTEHFAPVRLAGGEGQPGTVRPVVGRRVEDGCLVGDLVS
ncbi:tRNA (N(6)-L-threonylcarbamoyladenosine(37)-C(2))-methylthiotransferase MtaB [Marinivivus vitaminiproducens]|uniref:tRNA (N(6)-L-threonylcarbamoyladenosine(37)-C(2))- methylthiotransferase MtaB n=1 Tax=Marinivivus vitaminiproducens TaxID=3035935 RepID=UPI0027A6F8B8|nr:tRNA (N(6)-L-threonylcarbamoyladenosine(37)-C(2))-methylthiotransferase MtaB [Geminicoccaceae bacterium SCSIO 64248]